MQHLPRDIGEQIAFPPSGPRRLMDLLLRLLGLGARPLRQRGIQMRRMRIAPDVSPDPGDR
jgi:hypothetical protein